MACYGPIVMNTEEEMRTAFGEYRSDTSIKHRGYCPSPRDLW